MSQVQPAYFDTTHKEQDYNDMYHASASDGDFNSFDLATIHPSHGLSAVTGAFIVDGEGQEQSSEASKVLAALAAYGEGSDGGEAHSLPYHMEAGGEVQDWNSDSSFDATGTSPPERQSQLHRNDSTSSSFYFSSSLSSSTTSMCLERRSSCYFDPPSVEQHARDSPVPLDHALIRRLSTSTTPAVPAGPLDQSNLPSSAALSFSLAPTQSTSSFMLRSYSAPAHTQMQFNALKEKWNAEALLAAEHTEAGPSNIQASPRPKMARRNTSAHIPSLRRQRDSVEDQPYDSYGSNVHDTFSSHSHLLSPAHKRNPFKRSRLSFTSIREVDDTYSEAASSPQSYTTETRAPSPPKSPVRPSLNRFFTTPEFYLGDMQDENDGDAQDEGLA